MPLVTAALKRAFPFVPGIMSARQLDMHTHHAFLKYACHLSRQQGFLSKTKVAEWQTRATACKLLMQPEVVSVRIGILMVSQRTCCNLTAPRMSAGSMLKRHAPVVDG
eukprot:TRINITY_DN96123_c0_g1_i1.p1 TRINITY_DN96123_c0_g1~~TRINITY_DN96123_c0_g1_i1.p1  ORF type:complete len:108 (+),score=17.20 TRINITY_DN96123_c0_g1_i1:680-1003(+)